MPTSELAGELLDPQAVQERDWRDTYAQELASHPVILADLVHRQGDGIELVLERAQLSSSERLVIRGWLMGDDAATSPRTSAGGRRQSSSCSETPGSACMIRAGRNPPQGRRSEAHDETTWSKERLTACPVRGPNAVKDRREAEPGSTIPLIVVQKVGTDAVTDDDVKQIIDTNEAGIADLMRAYEAAEKVYFEASAQVSMKSHEGTVTSNNSGVARLR
jgi:hypothetical protein